MHTLPLDPTQQGFGFRQQLRAVSEVLMSIPQAQQPTWPAPGGIASLPYGQASYIRVSRDERPREVYYYCI